MKSNEEFIAGIYEKAAAYTEEKEIKVVKTRNTAKIVRIAAMAVVCVGLAGVGTLLLGRGNGQNPGGVPEQAGNNYGIALTSELGDKTDGIAQCRIGPVLETVTFTGVIESIDTEENRIWIKLLFDESAPDYVENSIVCIRWDMLEKIGETVAVGDTITATGALSQYENEASEHNGCAELILTDMANLIIR
ncbi:MAG: hypothetical protein J6K04_08500 [Lachnospiraceae bacterium]|nr:hypothetical protein [Lachnospiraceae bacterium]